MRGAVHQTKTGLTLNVKGKTVPVQTVVLRDVSINGKLRGTVTEATEKYLKPRNSVAQWDRLKYVCSIGKYVSIRTHEPVTEAAAAYLVGGDIYYLPKSEANPK